VNLTQAARRPRFTDVFVRRPVLAVVISLALVLIGVRVALDMPVLQYPQIESASLVITTPYIGAPAEVVQGFITDPIERAAATIPGVDFIESVTTAGLSTVTVYLELNEKSTDALAELSTRLGQIRFELPVGAEDPAVQVRRADRPQAGWYLGVDLNQRTSHAEVTDYRIDGDRATARAGEETLEMIRVDGRWYFAPQPEPETGIEGEDGDGGE